MKINAVNYEELKDVERKIITTADLEDLLKVGMFYRNHEWIFYRTITGELRFCHKDRPYDNWKW